MCVTIGVTGIRLFLLPISQLDIRFAGGTEGADETGANKDAHQSPVIQLETSNCIPAFAL